MNIQNPVETADNEHKWSMIMTQRLSEKIQNQCLADFDTLAQSAENHKDSIREVKSEKVITAQRKT